MTCPSVAKKSCGSHLLGVGPGEADETAFMQELSKAITFFVLVLSWWNFTFELGWSRAFQQYFGLCGALKKNCTSHQFTPYANWSVTKSVSTTLEVRRVSGGALAENWTPVFGGRQNLETVRPTVYKLNAFFFTRTHTHTHTHTRAHTHNAINIH